MQSYYSPFALIIALVCFQNAVKAVPQGQLVNIPPAATNISKDSPDQFDRFAKLSSAAYCDSLHNAQPGTKLCSNPDASCSDLLGLETVMELEGTSAFHIAAFLAHDKRGNELVVALRGTATLLDVVTDLAKRQTDGTEVCGTQCGIHYGFLLAWRNVKESIELKIDELRNANSNIRVIMTGHSLGGAVATIMTTYLRRKGKSCDLYTYGAPRVGDKDFVSVFHNMTVAGGQELGFTARITQRQDIVPAIPPTTFCGYHHIFPEFWYKNGITTDKVPTPFDESLREGGPGGCANEAECTSANCVGISGLLGCSPSDHRIKVYASGPPTCPGLGGRFISDQIPTAAQFQELSIAVEEESKEKGPVISLAELQNNSTPAGRESSQSFSANLPTPAVVEASRPSEQLLPSIPKQPSLCIFVPYWCGTCCTWYPTCCRSRVYQDTT